MFVSSTAFENNGMIPRKYTGFGEEFGNQDYGYLWWLPHRTDDVAAAIGDGGNVIYVNRKEKAVICVTGYFKPLVFDRIEFIEQNVLSAMV